MKQNEFQQSGVKGKTKQAEPLYKQSLAILESSLGFEHPDVAAVLDNLAILYRAMERNEEAEILEQRAVSIRAVQR